MERKTIGVDLDDVLAKHALAFVALVNKRYGLQLTEADYNNDWRELLGIDMDEVQRLAKAFHLGKSVLKFAVKEEAEEALAILKESHDLVVVTARRRELTDTTNQWIQEHFPGVFADIRIVPVWTEEKAPTKGEVCREVGASYLIDDDPGHCISAADAGISALLFDVPWNRNIEETPGVKRVNGWPGIIEYFDAAA